jgi:hypothetical protein
MKLLSALLILSMLYACQPAQETPAAATAAAPVAKNCT